MGVIHLRSIDMARTRQGLSKDTAWVPNDRPMDMASVFGYLLPLPHHPLSGACA